MNKELDSTLCAKYPKIFVDRRGDKMKTAMCWGFPGDGWYDILDRLCEGIQNHCDEIGQQVKATQVKEKFGTLRFYLDGGDTFIDALVDKAEEKSGETCEVCGSPGKLRGGGWALTLCDEHAKERNLGAIVRE